MPQQSPSRTSDKAMIRFPDGMRDWIAEEASRNYRSSNAQIVWIIKQAMEASKAKKADASN